MLIVGLSYLLDITSRVERPPSKGVVPKHLPPRYYSLKNALLGTYNNLLLSYSKLEYRIELEEEAILL